MRQSHYTILGISPGESPEGVRAAYLRLARKHHPDHAGEAGAEAFRDIQNAYDILSNPARRRAYDRQSTSERPAWIGMAEPLTARQTIEPLVPDTPDSARWPSASASAFHDLLDAAFAGVTPLRSRQTSTTPEVVVLDVPVSPEQAERGGELTITVPTPRICPVCAGTGVNWPTSCVTCLRRGWIAHELVYRLQVPPGVRHGTVMSLHSRVPVDVPVRVRFIIERQRRAPPVW